MFRKTALDSLASPEKLDQPLPLIRPRYWTLLASLLGFAGLVLGWMIMGRLPVRLSGPGILIVPNSLQLLQSETNGQVVALLQPIGRCVAKGSALVQIRPVDLKLQRDKSNQQLSELRNQNRISDQLNASQLAGLEADLKRLQPYRRSGAIPEQTFVDKQQALQSLRSQLYSQGAQREQQITDRALELGRLNADLARESWVRSTHAGCIKDLRVQAGALVTVGQPLVEIDSSGHLNELQNLAYFPSQDGKRIAVGQPVQVTPTVTQPQRHGAIQGRVVAVRPLPVSEEALLNRLGNRSLVNEIVKAAGSGSALIEVRTALSKDPATYSGFNWGGGPGPHLHLSGGTATRVNVLVESRAPISYLLPILRDLTSLY